MSIISTISSQITSNIFSKIDTGNQGYLEKSDLTSALSGLSNDDDTSAEEVFNQIDTDGDGKITKSELSAGVETLLSQLETGSFNNIKEGTPPPPPNGMGGMPPPPPPEASESEGVTEEEAAEIAASSTDSNLSSLMQTISENFEAADADGDGKVSREEAMAYVQDSGMSNDATKTASSNTSTQDALIQNMIAELVKSYGFDTESSSSLSALA